MKKSLLQLIAEADDTAVNDKPKKKFTVTVTDADGNEVQKTAMAYNIGDIKAYWASGARPDETFVKADLHDEEVGEPPADDADAPVDDTATDDADAAPTDDMTADDLPPGDEPDADEAPVDDEAAAEPDADDEELDDEGKPKKKAPKKEPKGDAAAADAMAAVDEDKKKDFDQQRVLYGAMSKKEFDAKWNKPEPMSKQAKAMAGPGGLYKNLITGVPGADRKAQPAKKLPAAKAVPASTKDPKYKPAVKHSGVEKVGLSKLESFAATGPALTEGYSEDDIAIGGTVIYKSGKGYKFSKAKSKSYDNVKLVNGDSIAMGAVVSTDFSDWKQFKDKQIKESIVTEMAKRSTPADFYKMVVAVHGAKGAESVSWADIKAVADKNDVLIPVYIRDQKVARGRWTAKPKDMNAPAHEPSIEKKVAPGDVNTTLYGPKDAPKTVAPAAKAAHAAVKDEPKGMEYKEHYKKEDFPDVEFAWTTTYHSGNDLLVAIEKHHGVKPEDTKRLEVDKRDNYYIVKKGTMDVLGRVTVTDGGIQPGRGRVAYVEGNIAISAKAKKDRDENLYGFWVKPQHGKAHVSVGTQHSHGPWSKFSAEANVRDKYQHYEYDDEFGHGTISVVKVKKVNGQWERA
jgi:hypothetical protein